MTIGQLAYPVIAAITIYVLYLAIREYVREGGNEKLVAYNLFGKEGVKRYSGKSAKLYRLLQIAVGILVLFWILVSYLDVF